MTTRVHTGVTVSVSTASVWSGSVCMFGDTFDISVTVSSFFFFFFSISRGFYSSFYYVLHSHCRGLTCTGGFCRCWRGVYRVEARRSFLTGRSRAVGSLTSSLCLCNAGDSPLDLKRRINSAYSERVEVYFVTRLVCVFSWVVRARVEAAERLVKSIDHAGSSTKNYRGHHLNA